jgi:hypothetical protein
MANINTHSKTIRNIDSILEPVSHQQDVYRENELRRKKIMREADAFGRAKLADMPAQKREEFLKKQEQMSEALNPNGQYLAPGTALRVVPILDKNGREVRDPTSSVLKEIKNNPTPMKILHSKDDSELSRKVREVSEAINKRVK